MMPITQVRPPPHGETAAAIPEEPPSARIAWRGVIAETDRILVLGGRGSDVMCALLRAGAGNVTHLRAHERAEAGGADVVIIPAVPSLDWLATALPSVRRALSGHRSSGQGRIDVCAGEQPAIQRQVRRMLSLNGFHTAGAGIAVNGPAIFGALPASHILRAA